MAKEIEAPEEELKRAMEFVNSVLEDHNSCSEDYRNKVKDATTKSLVLIMQSAEAEILEAGPLVSIMALRIPSTRHTILKALSQACIIGINAAKTGMV